MRVPGTIVLNCCLYASDGMRIETIVASEKEAHKGAGRRFIRVEEFQEV